jgi:hypothetical protein
MFGYLVQRRVGWIPFFFLMVACIFTAVYFLYRSHSRIRHLYEPKLLMLRVDEVAFPKGGSNPIEVMAGSQVRITCETVGLPAEMGRAGFRFHVGGKTYPSSTGKLDVVIGGEIGSTQKVAIDYLVNKPGGSSRAIDHYEALVKLIPGGEYFRIHSVADSEGHPLEYLTVGQQVIPYVDAALQIPGKAEQYTVLFFVEAYGTDSPVLQVSSSEGSKQKFEPIAAPLKRHRGYGPKMGGYAAWPDEPIQIGDAGQDRMIFQVYAGLFETNKVNSVVQSLLSYDGTGEQGQVKVRVHPVRREQIKALAWRGWLSDPIRVVRTQNPSPEKLMSQPPRSP